MSKFASDLRAVQRRLGGKLPPKLAEQLANAKTDGEKQAALAACRTAADMVEKSRRKTTPAVAASPPAPAPAPAAQPTPVK